MNNKLGIGTVQFGMPYGISNKIGQTKFEEVEEILTIASDKGITYIDTASAYGNAEEVLGRNDLSHFRVITKFLPPAEDAKLIDLLKESLKKLNIPSVYGYLAHRPLSIVENPNLWEELLELKRNNLVEKIGFSLNDPEEIKTLLKYKFVPDLIQAPFNFFDNRFEDIFIELKSKGCEIHSRSAFLQGLFFADFDNLPSFFDEAKSHISALQNKFGDQLSGVLLNYVLAKPFIDVVIIGLENREQLETNLLSIQNRIVPESTGHIFSKQIISPSLWPKS